MSDINKIYVAKIFVINNELNQYYVSFIFPIPNNSFDFEKRQFFSGVFNVYIYLMVRLYILNFSLVNFPLSRRKKNWLSSRKENSSFK